MSHMEQLQELVRRAREFQLVDDAQSAEATLSIALSIDPIYLPAAAAYGHLLASQQRFEELRTHCEPILTHSPHQPYFANLLGIALRQLGRLSDALEVLIAAHDHSPCDPNLLTSLGNAYVGLRYHHLAIDCFGRALALDDSLVHAQFNLGNAYQALGWFGRAELCYRRAWQLAPQRADIANNLATALAAKGELEGAVAVFESLVRDQPAYAAAHFNLSLAQEDLDQHAEAAASLDRAITLAPEQLLWPLRRQRSWPPVFADEGEIQHAREGLLAACPQWQQQLASFSLGQICRAGVFPPFHTAHQADDERSLREQLARCFPRPSATNEQRAHRSRHAKPRIGWIVTPGHENLFLRCCGGILQRLDLTHHEHVLFMQAGMRKLATSQLPVMFHDLPPELETAAAAIDAQSCDLLYHWEIGTDSLNYFLPMLRLAPLQCTSWGTVTTSGLPEVDYYLSSLLVEKPSGSENYTEQLVALDSLLSCQSRVAMPADLAGPAHFGLSPDRRYYVCVQNLLKIHPSTDELFASLLRADDRALLVLKHRRWPRVGELLQRRFRVTMPDVADRVHFLPWQSRDDYYRLIQFADCLLDTPHYGAGSSCYDIFSANQPMITLPGELNIGRYALGCYRAMQVTEPVVADASDYVAKAIRTATDVNYRIALQRQIAAASHVLFDDLAVVRQYEAFIDRVLARSS